MIVKELKDWLNKLPEETNDFQVVIRDLKMLEDDKVYNRDSSVSYGLVDSKIKQINLFDTDSTKVIQKIKAASEQKIEGSNVVNKNVNDETV